ncbi:hypothetical protein L798_10288 [Zootermopsis nevadensis]|uniref:Uncharacterized protein n=1 Tax=Zootermopsis nevadensis TaxID=136037 RepID=A0A067QYX7_ZOONE|nr:hypothetical protein L798_10288 [Zootermopsis nevadensis]
MRGSAVVHVENNYEGIVAHTSDVISLLPVAQQAATEPESSHPGSASLVSRTAYPDLSPGLEDTSQDSLTHLHNQYIRANRHKSGSTVRSLRNLACRRARQSDMRNVNFVLEEQCTTEDFKTTVGSETLDRRQPTVRVERLGRIVPTSNGSYHILDTSRLESSSYVSARSFRVDGEVARVCTEMDRVSGAVDGVSGAVDGVSGAYDVTDGGDFVNDGYSSMVDLDSANNSSQNEKISSGKSQNFRNSTFESRIWERDLTFDTVRNSHACPENISTNGKSFQNNVYQDWQPLYENISDPDSEPDSIKGTEPLQELKCELVSTKHVNLDCDIPKDYEDRSRDSEVKKRKTVSVNKRRHSAPDHSERRRKKEKQKERHRRLSFNTETDMPQTDHIEPTNKPYLSRLVLCKDAKVKSWNVVIDLAHDEKTTDDEFKAPALPLLNNITLIEGNGNAEKKEAVRAITEDSSSDIEDSAKESRASNEKTKSWDYSSYELNQEMKIEDEDTIEAPRGFFSVPKDHVTNTCSSESAKKECSLPNETVGVVTKSLGTKLKVENTVPTIDTLSADKSNLEVLRVTDSLERFSVDNSIVAKIERDEFVKGVSCNSANSMHVEEYSGLETQNQNTDIASERSIDPGELRGSLGSDASGNKVSGVGRRGSFQEGPSGTACDDAASKVNFSNRTADSLLVNSENVSSVGINSATTENSASSNNVGWSRNFEERVHPGRKMNDKILESGKEEVYKNFENHPSLVSKTMPSQQSITGEENFTKRSFENNNASISSRSHNPVNCGQDNEVDNYGADTDVELSIDESKVDRTTDHAHMKHCAGVQIDSENTTEDLKTARESHDLTSGNSGFVSSKMKKKKRRRKELIISMERRKHEEKKETSSDNYRIHKKTRFSRRSFRHDSIQMFKVSTAFPPHTTLVPWRYKCKKSELPDPVDTRDVNPPSPVLNPIPTQSRFDDNVTNIELEDIPSPGSLTIDLGEQNTNTPDTSDTKEEEGSRKKCNSDGSGGEEETVSRHRSRTKSSESDSVMMKEKATLDASTENDQEHPQSGDLDSDYSNEGQSKTKRKSMKKRKSVDSTVTADVMQHIFMAQMQEKGRRLAQELPGFNWLEEKIRNGGVSTVLTPRRLSGTTCSSSNGGSTVDTSSTDMRAVPTSDAAAVVLSPHVSKSTLDAARSNEPPLSSSPTEYRHSKRLQEYLSSPPKRAKQVSPVASELENQRQALVSARSAHEHGETLRAPATSAPMPTLQRLLHCPQLKSPRQIQSAHTVPEREPSPHQQQSSRRPVIVMASELSKRSDVSPLLQQLTSGGELEVTLSTLPTSSSASSDSGVGSASSHRTSSDAEQTEVTHIRVKPVHGRNGPQNADERPSDSIPSRSVGYGVDHLSQFHQPEKNSFVPQDRIPVHVWNREPPQWQGGK